MKQEYLDELVQSAEIFIGVGTSAQVYPAAGLLPLFRRTQRKFFIDPHPAYDVLDGFEVLKGTASEQMPGIVARLLSANGAI
jgi:NAD-dependent deacetylase